MGGTGVVLFRSTVLLVEVGFRFNTLLRVGAMGVLLFRGNISLEVEGKEVHFFRGNTLLGVRGIRVNILLRVSGMDVLLCEATPYWK